MSWKSMVVLTNYNGAKCDTIIKYRWDMIKKQMDTITNSRWI